MSKSCFNDTTEVGTREIRVTGLTNDVSCEDSGDPIARKHDHRVDSERVYGPCVSACAASARLNGQTSSRSPPTCICTVSRLKSTLVRGL